MDHPSRTAAISISGPIRREDIDGLCARASSVVEESWAGLLECDLGGAKPDAVAVEALARLHLVARRRGCRLVLVSGPPELMNLVWLMGLGDVLPGCHPPDRGR